MQKYLVIINIGIGNPIKLTLAIMEENHGKAQPIPFLEKITINEA
ncbi:MAG: hypothetical protein R3E32_07155 [Chitinophagales bacterium]